MNNNVYQATKQNASTRHLMLRIRNAITLLGTFFGRLGTSAISFCLGSYSPLCSAGIVNCDQDLAEIHQRSLSENNIDRFELWKKAGSVGFKNVCIVDNCPGALTNVRMDHNLLCR